MLAVPVGSCEQHGPHLPVDTDTRIAVAVAVGLAEERGDVTVAPAVAFGSSGEHQSFPGTLSVGTDALAALLVELGRSAFPDPDARTYRALVFVNGHGGNSAALASAVGLLEAEGRPVTGWAPHTPDGDAHAGRTETSLMLAIAPDLVRPERPVGTTTALDDLLEDMRSGGVASVAPDGVLGDATGASEVEGRQILVALVEDLSCCVDAVLTRS